MRLNNYRLGNRLGIIIFYFAKLFDPLLSGFLLLLQRLIRCFFIKIMAIIETFCFHLKKQPFILIISEYMKKDTINIAALSL